MVIYDRTKNVVRSEIMGEIWRPNDRAWRPEDTSSR